MFEIWKCSHKKKKTNKKLRNYVERWRGTKWNRRKLYFFFLLNYGIKRLLKILVKCLEIWWIRAKRILQTQMSSPNPAIFIYQEFQVSRNIIFSCWFSIPIWLGPFANFLHNDQFLPPLLIRKKKTGSKNPNII